MMRDESTVVAAKSIRDRIIESRAIHRVSSTIVT
jgi:hypothetical protein